MPIFEYECRVCGHEFERLVRPGDVLACPACQSPDLEKLLSLSSVSTPSTRASAFQQARHAGRPLQQEKQQAEIDEIKHHYGENALTPLKPGPLRKKR